MRKRIILIVITIVMVMTQMFSFTLPAQAGVVTTPNKTTYVRYSPYWFTTTTDTITTSQSITVLERDGDYYYIEYRKSTENYTRRGYVPMADVTVSGIPWCDYEIYTPGEIIATSSVKAYFGPNIVTYMGVTMIPIVLGDDTIDGVVNDSRPLLVLDYDGASLSASSFLYIQYVANYTELTNDVQPFFIRCWVPKSAVKIKPTTATSYFPGGQYTLIRNINSGLYLTALQDSSGTWYAELQEPTGNANQWWRVIKCGNQTTGIYYKIQSSKCSKVLQVENNRPQCGAKIVLADIASPNKAQEFELEEFTSGKETYVTGPVFNYNSKDVGYVYRVRTRTGGTYQCMSIINGKEVVHTRVAATWVGLWSFEQFNKHYSHTYARVQKNDSSYTVKYYIYTGEGKSTDVENANITLYQIRTGIQKWHSIKEGGVQLIKTQEVYDLSQADVVIKAEEFEEKDDALAITEVEWYDNPKGIRDYSIIKLNSYSDNDNKFESIAEYSGIYDNAQVGVVTHEFGHALFLKHPYGNLSHTESGEWDYKDQVVYSVMNQGGLNAADANDSKRKRVYQPSSYDGMTLRNKW